MLAYLVIREGTKWTDVYRLVPGQTVTLGRAPSNQIVIKDERCSRSHAEIFLSEDRWHLRDLGSRNGTLVDGERVENQYTLEPEDVIKIGGFQMKFVLDVSSVFPDSSSVLKKAGPTAETLVESDLGHESESVLSDDAPNQIMHRAVRTKYLTPHPGGEDSATPKVGKAATALCRLAFQLANATDLSELSEVALSGVFDETRVDAGALLLLPRDFPDKPSGPDLEVFAAKTTSEQTYHRVSDFLATTVLREGEAILARNVMDDSVLGGRDSKGDIHATSVICAPIRRGDRVLGLIHLYSTRSDLVPDSEDLEFTLAVA